MLVREVRVKGLHCLFNNSLRLLSRLEHGLLFLLLQDLLELLRELFVGLLKLILLFFVFSFQI